MLLLHVGNWMCTPHSWGSVPVVTYSFSPQKVVLKDISLGLKTNLKQFPFEMTKENRIRRNKPFLVSCLSSCSFQDFPSLPHKWLNYSKWWMIAFVLSLAAYTAALRTFLPTVQLVSRVTLCHGCKIPQVNLSKEKIATPTLSFTPILP